jgi:hypothetical protein
VPILPFAPAAQNPAVLIAFDDHQIDDDISRRAAQNHRPSQRCLRRAEECRRRARLAMDAQSIEHHLKMEQRWLFLAQSRQFAERIHRFIRA